MPPRNSATARRITQTVRKLRAEGSRAIPEVRARLRLYRSQPLALRRRTAKRVDRGMLRGRQLPRNLREWPAMPSERRRRPVTAGVILDSFSANAFAPEWRQVELHPRRWRQQIEGIDLLFVESAWHGNQDAWQYQLTPQPSQQLRELVAECQRRGIPTVFWNKEDPAHYADFLPTARLFDWVFTTDGARVPDYRRDLGHDRVRVLSFAAQPAIHNPVRPAFGHASRDVAFGGMYFAHKFPERRQQMQVLLGAAQRAARADGMCYGLEIFSRFLGRDRRYQFPRPLSRSVIGSVDYGRMLSAYRLYKVFVNVNSVVDSPSMCARRIFELAACGTSVVTMPTPAIGALFTPRELCVVSDEVSAYDAIRALVKSSELRDRMNHLAARRIWAGHTYGHRVAEVLSAAGLLDVGGAAAGSAGAADGAAAAAATPTADTPPASSPAAAGAATLAPQVSVLCCTNRPGNVDQVLRMAAAQKNVHLQLCVLTHGFTDDSLAQRARAAGLEDVLALEAPAERTLGECLNQLVEAASAPVLAKWDDDDLYGPHYLEDQLAALMFTEADVVGKQAHYVRLEAAEPVVALAMPTREHCFTNFVAGPTLVFTREVAARYPFAARSRGEDTDFLRRVLTGGGRIYAADRFNFIRSRRSSGDHTWQVTDYHILSRAEIRWVGDMTQHIML